MRIFGKLLLGAALAASLPAMAVAQRGPDGPGRGEMRPEGGDRRGGDFRPDRTPGAPRPDRAPGFAGGRGYDGDRDGYRDDRARLNADRRPDDGRRFDNDRRFDDRRPGFAGRPDYGRRPDGRGGWDDRRGDNRWVGTDWRNDRRYDWQGWRAGNRQAFRPGRYIAPRGWGYGYRRFSIGVTAPGLLWGSNYWINDPYSYHLPPAYGPYRWVRYYDDVMLIDTISGRVVDVIPNFFW